MRHPGHGVAADHIGHGDDQTFAAVKDGGAVRVGAGGQGNLTLGAVLTRENHPFMRQRQNPARFISARDKGQGGGDHRHAFGQIDAVQRNGRPVALRPEAVARPVTEFRARRSLDRRQVDHPAPAAQTRCITGKAHIDQPVAAFHGCSKAQRHMALQVKRPKVDIGVPLGHRHFGGQPHLRPA